MKKRVIAYLVSSAIMFSLLSGAGAVTYADEESDYAVDVIDQIEGDSSETILSDISDEEDIIESEDEYMVDADDESEYEDFSSDEQDVMEELSDCSGLIEDISDMEAAGETVTAEEILFAADEAPISADGTDIQIGTGNEFYYPLKDTGTGEYHFVGIGINKFQLINRSTDEEISENSYIFKNVDIDEDTLFLSANLVSGTEYILRVVPEVSGNRSFYCYKSPLHCMEMSENTFPSDVEDVDLPSLGLKVTILYSETDQFEADLDSVWVRDVNLRYYFPIDVDSLTKIDHGDGTSSIAFKDGHGWDEGTVIVEPTCGSDGTREYHCACGKGTRPPEPIPKTNNHTWSAYNAQGDRTCSVCNARQHDASKVRPAAPVYNISGKPAKVKVKAVGGRKLTVTWKKPNKSKLKQIKGVYIEVAADSGFKNIIKTKKVNKSKTSFTFKKLKKGMKYYVRVRFYKGTQISRWSAVKNKKVK